MTDEDRVPAWIDVGLAFAVVFTILSVVFAAHLIACAAT